MLKLNKTILCADGFRMSVQASADNYCSPRISNAKRYDAVEVGFPSREEPLLMEYADDTNWTDTVYGYVPVQVVTNIIAKHGGMMEGEVPPGVPTLWAN
jgi:hypothetical protein